MKASLIEAWPVTRQVSLDGVSLKKQGPSHHLDHSRSLVLFLHLIAGSYGDLIWPFKTSLRGFDLALMVDLIGSAHHPDGLEYGQWALMKKLGGGPPSPWCCTNEEKVAQLLHCYRHPPQNKNGTS